MGLRKVKLTGKAEQPMYVIGRSSVVFVTHMCFSDTVPARAPVSQRRLLQTLGTDRQMDDSGRVSFMFFHLTRQIQELTNTPVTSSWNFTEL